MPFHPWNVRYKRWPQLWERMNANGHTHEEFLERIAKHYGWTVPQAYIATEFMFRPENYN